MGTKMDIINVGDFIFYDTTFVSISGGVGLVLKKVYAGENRIMSKRELAEMVDKRVLPRQILKATRMFEPTVARLDTVIMMTAQETETKIIYKIIAKPVQHTHPHTKAAPIKYNTIDKEAALRRAEVKKEKALLDIKRTRAQKAATVKRLNAVKEKGGDAWTDAREKVKLQQQELAEERRLQRLIKQSRIKIYGQ